jgi:imidazoleglycerol-phosphate dehydratase
MKERVAEVKRKTSETDIRIRINIDGTGKSRIDTGMPFLDHMLESFSKHSLIDMTVAAKGDLAVDYHHTVEDIGLCIGEALDKALGNRSGIVRYGSSLLPMDDALSRVAVDLGGRPYLVYEVANRKRKIGDFDLGLVGEFMQSLCVQARINLHVAQLYGKEAHHAYESMFKALAKALLMACTRDPRVKGLPSSKGKI